VEDIIMTEDERNYINLLNDAINRMASNSANAKSYLVAIVAALMAIQMPNKNNAYIILSALLPTFLFYWMDCYYLSLEKRFRYLQTAFIKKEMKDGRIIAGIYKFNIYEISDKHPKIDAILSWSTTPFYAVVALCIVGLWFAINYL
jgi:hypothetical protein